jgi:hypothetical protein
MAWYPQGAFQLCGVINVPEEKQLPLIIPLAELADEFGYHVKSLFRLEREGKIPPLLRRAPKCHVFATEEHRRALVGYRRANAA